MTKGISSYPEQERTKVILRRIAKPTMGNGYWAARDAMARLEERAANRKRKVIQPKAA